jgi:hypothetical protein
MLFSTLALAAALHTEERPASGGLLSLLLSEAEPLQVAGGSRLVRGAASPPPRARPEMKWGVDIAPWKIEYGQQDSGVPLPPGTEEGQAPEPFAISEEQIQELKELGAVRIPGLLSKEWLEYLRAATDWQVANPHFWSTAGVSSGLYDYIQRSIWSSNDAFAKFYYYSPLMSALAGLANATELRLATDLLMVNPNRGFKWHQDNQNGPIDAFGNEGGSSNPDFASLRWWVTMDDTPVDHGAPVYLKGSHFNEKVENAAVFVDLEKDDLLKYEPLEFQPKAGDLLVWHARSIHKIDGPSDQDWGKSKRRVLGGTVAVDDSKYLPMGRVLFSDMGSHGLIPGDKLQGPLFPIMYPISEPVERAERQAGRCTRTWEGQKRLFSNMAASAGEMLSFLNVVNPDDAKKK